MLIILFDLLIGIALLFFRLKELIEHYILNEDKNDYNVTYSLTLLWNYVFRAAPIERYRDSIAKAKAGTKNSNMIEEAKEAKSFFVSYIEYFIRFIQYFYTIFILF